VLKAGIDLDMYDKFGRTIITLEEDIGLNIGNLHKKDPLATRPGAGAEFVKLVGNLYRLQPMPWASTILWKNSFQASSYNLLAVEQFQLGGISNVRGYSPAEYSGDAGYTTTVEWSFPIYGLPKDIKVPLSKSTVYDALRVVGFYDLGYVHIKTPVGADKQDRTVQGYGAGIRFNLPEDFSARFESAWRINSKAAFGDANLYVDVSKKF
jgi:hemolysin activation/secretion protein